MNDTIIFCYRNDDKEKKCLHLALQDFDPKIYTIIYVDIDELRKINQELKKTGKYVFIKKDFYSEKRIFKEDFDPRTMKLSIKESKIINTDSMPVSFVNHLQTERFKNLPYGFKYSEENEEQFEFDKNKNRKSFLKDTAGFKNPTYHLSSGVVEESNVIRNKRIRFDSKMRTIKR